MESAFTTSPPSVRARARESSDLPAAVGPTTAMTGRSIASVWQRRVWPCTRDVAEAHLVFGSTMTYADDLDTPSEEDEFDLDAEDELDDEDEDDEEIGLALDDDDEDDDDEYDFDDDEDELDDYEDDDEDDDD